MHSGPHRILRSAPAALLSLSPGPCAATPLARRTLRPLALGLTSLLGGCGAFGVDTFAGSVLAMNIGWPLNTKAKVDNMGPDITTPITPKVGAHLDLWAVKDNVPQRVIPEGRDGAFAGFDVRLVVDPNEPCLIDHLSDPAHARGQLLLSASAQSGATEDERQRQLMAVVQHSRQTLSRLVQFKTLGMMNGAYLSGRALSNLLVLTERYAGPTPPAISVEDPSQDAARLAACSAFFQSVADKRQNYYIGNPRQYTLPLLGSLFGFFEFRTTVATEPDLPTQSFGGIGITTKANLAGVSKLLLTLETTDNPSAPNPDPQMLVMQGLRLTDELAGRGAARYQLVVTTSVMGMPQTITVGSASILANLDQGL